MTADNWCTADLCDGPATPYRCHRLSVHSVWLELIDWRVKRKLATDWEYCGTGSTLNPRSQASHSVRTTRQPLSCLANNSRSPANENTATFVISARHRHGFSGDVSYRRQTLLDGGSKGSTRGSPVGQAEPARRSRRRGAGCGRDVWIAWLDDWSPALRSRATTEQHRQPRRSSTIALWRSDTTQGNYIHWLFPQVSPVGASITRRALGGVHVPPTKVFPRLTTSVNESIVKPRVAAAANTYTSDFPDVKVHVPALIR